MLKPTVVCDCGEAQTVLLGDVLQLLYGGLCPRISLVIEPALLVLWVPMSTWLDLGVRPEQFASQPTATEGNEKYGLLIYDRCERQPTPIR